MALKYGKLILTVPAHAKFGEFASDPVVEGVRINTTIPVKLTLEETLSNARQEARGKDLWIDLKCRQLRIVDYDVKILQDSEIHYLTLSHEIAVNTPTQVMLDNGKITGNITQIIDNKKLVIPSSVERGQGLPFANRGEVGIRKGMSVTILDPSLKVNGYLTDKDKEYIQAAKKLGVHTYMLSFVEQESDINDLLALDDEARIIAKIESPSGLEFVRSVYPEYRKFMSPLRGKINLMAARGDLYLQVPRPDQIIAACKEIVDADYKAIFASRILESLANPQDMPKCGDLFDITCGMYMGYRRFMLGDDVCRKRESVTSAIGLFEVLTKNYNNLKK